MPRETAVRIRKPRSWANLRTFYGLENTVTAHNWLLPFTGRVSGLKDSNVTEAARTRKTLPCARKVIWIKAGLRHGDGLFFLVKILFEHEQWAGGAADSPLSRAPDTGLDPRILTSRPELEAGASPAEPPRRPMYFC